MLSPLPVAFALLSLALPLIWLAGRALAATMGGARSARAVVAPALGLSLWLLAIHASGRLARSFSVGLVVGTLVVALGGLVAALRARGRGVADPGPGAPLSRWCWLGAVVAAGVMAPAALRWALHDELTTTGHMSIPAQLQNDTYPPRHLTFPSFELRYHYAFDLLVAVTTALTRLRVDHAIDAVLLACWGYSWCLLWVLGERLGGRRGSGFLAASVTLFGGGMPFFSGPGFPPPVATILGVFNVDDMWPNPPLTSYVFQHPWTLGLPLGLAALLVATERRCRAAPRLVVLGVLLVMLSITQFVLFLTLTGALAAQELFSGGLACRRGFGRLFGAGLSVGRALGFAVLLAGVFLVAPRLGGFFNAPPDGAGSGLVVHLGVTSTLRGDVVWLFVSYGLLLPLGLAGLALLPRARVLLAALIAGSLAILNLLRVEQTWDIAKFGTVAAIALSVSASAAIAWLGSRRPRVLWLPVAAALFAGATAAGVAYPVIFGLKLRGIPGLFHREAAPLPPADDAAVRWLRTHVKPGELVYRRESASLGYALWGGLPQVWIDWNVPAFGFSPARIASRQRLFQEVPAGPEPYLAEGVRWLVLDAGDAKLKRRAAAWIQAGRAREVLAPAGLAVVEIMKQDASSAR